MSDFLTIRELAAQLKVTKATLFSLMKRGQFPTGVRIGRCRRWDVDKVNEWLDTQAQMAGN